MIQLARWLPTIHEPGVAAFLWHPHRQIFCVVGDLVLAQIQERMVLTSYRGVGAENDGSEENDARKPTHHSSMLEDRTPNSMPNDW